MKVDFSERAEEGKGEVVSKFLWRRRVLGTGGAVGSAKIQRLYS